MLQRPLKAARAAALPEVEAGTWYGTPGLLVKGKGFMRVKEDLPGTLVFRCPIDEKDALMGAMPHIYVETDHYKGWPAVLVRLSKIGEAELRQYVIRAWTCVAPQKLVQKSVTPKAVPKKKAAAKRG